MCNVFGYFSVSIVLFCVIKLLCGKLFLLCVLKNGKNTLSLQRKCIGGASVCFVI